MSNEIYNEKTDEQILAMLATLPKNKNAKLQDIVDHVRKIQPEPAEIASRKIKWSLYNHVSQRLGILKKARKVKYATGTGCGWRLP